MFAQCRCMVGTCVVLGEGHGGWQTLTSRPLEPPHLGPSSGGCLLADV